MVMPAILKPVVHYIVVTVEVPVVVTRCDLSPVAPSGVLAGQALLAMLRGPAVRPCPPSCSAWAQLRASVSGSASDGLVGGCSRQVAHGRGSSSWHAAECQRRVAADIRRAQQPALRVAAGAVSRDMAYGDGDPCQGWHISASRQVKSRWLVAEKQRKLAARVWQAQRLRVLQGARASVLQRWWRRCLAVRAGALQRLAVLEAARSVCKSLYSTIASSAKACLPQCPHVSDDDILATAILQARAEEEALQSSMQPIVEGMNRALKLMDDGCGGVPKCPFGHCLKAEMVLGGLACSICLQATHLPVVAVRCSETCCGFVSCCRAAGCAPAVLTKVLSALLVKHHSQFSSGFHNG